MQPTRPLTTGIDIAEVTRQRGVNPLVALVSSQAFWVTVAVLLICAATAYQQPETFPTKSNFYNVTRNFAFIGIVAMGMIAVILTGGIDLSVGSTMALVAVGTGRVLEAGYGVPVACLAGLGLGAAVGAANGILVAYVKLPSFVVTLGMLSIARSLAIVLSENRVIYELGPSGPAFKQIGGGQIALPWIDGGTLALSNVFVLLLVLVVVMSLVLNITTWGRRLHAIGGNEQAARLTGIPVDRIKLQAYILCGVAAALAAIMLCGWQGSASNGMGKSYELYVIAAAVIGGANLIGGEASAYGALIGAALIFLIRNSLIMFSIDANWYDLFVGLFIIFAVLLERLRRGRAG